jgi:hypothetical protein
MMNNSTAHSFCFEVQCARSTMSRDTHLRMMHLATYLDTFGYPFSEKGSGASEFTRRQGGYIPFPSRLAMCASDTT